MSDQDWLHEEHTPDHRTSYRVRRWLHSEESAFQRIAVCETTDYGRALVLDGVINTTEADEFAYHEMLVHPVLFSHPAPSRVLIIGGGDGGTLREVLRHPSVAEATLVEIDEAVIRVSREYLPTLASSFDHPKAKIVIGDGIRMVREAEAGSFDVVLVDGTDPAGPGELLFNEEFYISVRRALTPEGIAATHLSGGPFCRLHQAASVHRRIAGVFTHTRVWQADVPAYGPGGWLFAAASRKSFDEKQAARRAAASSLKARYYTPGLQTASTVLPGFVRAALQSSS